MLVAMLTMVVMMMIMATMMMMTTMLVLELTWNQHGANMDIHLTPPPAYKARAYITTEEALSRLGTTGSSLQHQGTIAVAVRDDT